MFNSDTDNFKMTVSGSISFKCLCIRAKNFYPKPSVKSGIF